MAARSSRPAILARSSIPDGRPPERLSALNWRRQGRRARREARQEVVKRCWAEWHKKTTTLSSTRQLWSNRKRNSAVFAGSSPLLMASLKISLCFRAEQQKSRPRSFALHLRAPGPICWLFNLRPPVKSPCLSPTLASPAGASQLAQKGTLWTLRTSLPLQVC